MDDSIILSRAREKLRFHEQEAERLEEKVREHRAQVTKHKAFLDVWDDLAPESGAGTEANTSEPPESPLRDPNLSQLEAARIGLELMGKGAGATDLAHFIMQRGFPYERGAEKLAASLRGVLAKAKDEPDSGIVKLEYGEYGLPAWAEKTDTSELLKL